MNTSISQAYKKTIERLEKSSVKYDVHNLSSGVIMLDIWYNNKFYVLQFENEFIGFSEINTDEPAFDTTPDEKFYETKKFELKITQVFR